MNKLKLNPDKIKVMLVGKVAVLKDRVFPTFDGVQLSGWGLYWPNIIVLETNLATKVLSPPHAAQGMTPYIDLVSLPACACAPVTIVIIH